MLAMNELLRALKVRPSSHDIDEHFLSHPDYPSLAAFSDALHAFGVEHEAYQAPADAFDGLPRPHLAYLDDEEFVVVESADSERVILGNGRSVPRAMYLGRWTGVLLAPKGVVPRDSKPGSTVSSRSVLSYVLLGLGGLSSLILSTLAHPLPPALFGMLALGLLGLTLSFLLAAESLGFATAAQKFCQMGAKTSCASVLASPAARLGPFSMVDIGVGFFGGAVLVGVVSASSLASVEATLVLMTTLSVVSLPYTLFSVGYQGLVVKRWCPLCLGVQAILWAQALLGLAAVGWTASLPDSWAAWSVVALYPLPFAVWLLVEPLSRRSLELRRRNIDYERLVRDSGVIRTLLEREAPAELPQVPIEIEYGQKHAPVTVTLYTDPTCAFCRDRHLELELAERVALGALRIVIRVLGPMHPDERALALIDAMAVDICSGDQARAHQRLAAWFHGDRTVSPSQALGPEAKAKVEQQEALRRDPPFNASPVIFVGDRRWPSRLPLRAVGYLARDLAE